MFNLGTLILSCVLCAFVGYSIGEEIGYKRYQKQTKEIKDYYLESTRKLVDYIANEKKKRGE